MEVCKNKEESKLIKKKYEIFNKISKYKFLLLYNSYNIDLHLQKKLLLFFYKGFLIKINKKNEIINKFFYLLNLVI